MKWLGASGGSDSSQAVSVVRSSTCVSERELSIISISAIVDDRTSSVGSRGIFISRRIFFTDWFSRSQQPPKCGAPGGLNFHVSSVSVNSSINVVSSTSFQASLSSRSAPTKFVSRSLRISVGLPRRAMNRRTAIMHDDVVSVCATSKCTARVVRQVNNTPHLFSLRRPIATVSGPK